jgi:uncharacterized membrane protein YdbT with pleckstrin-like domain
MGSYVESVLIPGEQVLYEGHISGWALLPKIALGVLLLPVGIGLIVLLWAFILYKSTELAITNKRIIAKFGFISRSTVEINLSKVESIQVDQGLLGRMCDFGTIRVHGTGSTLAPVPDISEPLAFRNQFAQATDRSQRG